VIFFPVLSNNSFESCRGPRVGRQTPVHHCNSPLPINPSTSCICRCPLLQLSSFDTYTNALGMWIPKDGLQSPSRHSAPQDALTLSESNRCAIPQTNSPRIKSLRKKGGGMGGGGVTLKFSRLTPPCLFALMAIPLRQLSNQFVGCASPSPCGRIISRVT